MFSNTPLLLTSLLCVRIHVTRDDSYIPFMFDRDTSGSTSQQDHKLESDVGLVEPARRRIFRQGTEVTFEPSARADRKPSEGPETKHETSAQQGVTATGHPRPTKTQHKSISDSSPNKITSEPDLARASMPRVRRHRLEGFLKPPGGAAPGFVKPAGVSSAAGTGAKRPRDDELGLRDGGRGSDIRKRRG